MSVMKQLRSASAPRPATRSRLHVESLESRLTPANLISYQYGGVLPVSPDALVVGTSREGRYVLFQTESMTVVEDQIDEPGTPDLFWMDTNTNEVMLVSAAANSGGLKALGVVPTVNGQPVNGVLSADGQSVAFVSNINASQFEGVTIQDDGDASADVFYWDVSIARVLNPTAKDFVALVSAEDLLRTKAVGATAPSTNPSIDADGSTVSFVTRRDANVFFGALLVTDNGDFSPDIFRADVSRTFIGPFATLTLSSARIVSVYTNPSIGVLSPFTFGKYSSVLEVDPLGRYMGGNGEAYTFLSGISPDRVNSTYSQSLPGTIDVYHLLQSSGGFGTTTNPQVTLVSTQPGQVGASVNGVASNAILPLDSSNTVIWSQTVPVGTPLISGYSNQNGGGLDLYLRTIQGTVTGAPQLISSQAGSQATGSNGALDQAIGSFAVGPDGARVYFTSKATNLVNGVTDTNANFDVFVRNVATGVTSAVSVTSAGNATGNNASRNPRVSDDGFVVGFESNATNLVGISDTNGATDVFIRDVSTGQTGAASSIPNGVSTGNARSFGPIVGGNKTQVSVYFNSFSTNLDPTFPVTNGSQQVYVTVGPLTNPGAGLGVAVSGGNSGFATIATAGTAGQLDFNAPFTPFPGYLGEIRVASGDVNGDGVADLIAGAGPGGASRIRVIDGATGATIYDFYAYETSFTGGIYVAAADFTGDGKADIVIGAGESGGPRIKILNGATRDTIADFFAFEESFRGGVRVATGDVNGDGVPDILAAAGIGGGPRVKIVSGTDLTGNTVIADFFAFEATLRNGVYVGAGDVNGDGLADVGVGAGPGGAPRVSVFNSTLLVTPILGFPERLYDFYAFPEASRDGVRVAIRNVNGDGIPDIVTGIGSGGPQLHVYSPAERSSAGAPLLIADQFAFDDATGQFGAFVG